jgi:hypothetical protein
MVYNGKVFRVDLTAFLLIRTSVTIRSGDPACRGSKRTTLVRLPRVKRYVLFIFFFIVPLDYG